MSGQNDILQFDENKDNILTQEVYASDTERLNGVKTGWARSILLNKVLRQCSMVASAFGEVIKNRGQVAQDAVFADLVTAITTAFPNASVNISYDHTTSGMTATNVQSAIDELKASNTILSTRACCNYGVYDTAGLPTLLSYSGSTLTLNATSINPTITDHLGVARTLTSNITFSATGLTGTFHVFYKADGTMFTSTNKPIFLPARPTSPITNQVYIYPDNTTWVAEFYNGSTWTTLVGVAYLGYFVASSGTISSVVNNRYNQNGYNLNQQTVGYRLPDYTKGVSKVVATTYQAPYDARVYNDAGNGICEIDVFSTSGGSVVDGIEASNYNGTYRACGYIDIPKGYWYSTRQGTTIEYPLI